MTKRRDKGDGGLYWNDKRKRWIAEVTIGYNGNGKRIVRKGSGRTKTEAKDKLKAILRDHEDGLAIAPTGYTVADAVEDWLEFGLPGRDKVTVNLNTSMCRNHVLPELGALKLRDLSATHVDKLLAKKSKTLSTRTLRIIHSCLNRAVKRAMARDKVKRNVVELCSVPTGRPGRPSKAFTVAQAKAVLEAAEGKPLHAYIVVSMLTGARTEELRALTWDHVDLKGDPKATPPVPPHIAVWRSVRASGDTKTRKSRRTLALPERCVEALHTHREKQERQRKRSGKKWQENNLVFASRVGTPLASRNVRRSLRTILATVDPELVAEPDEWTSRETRTSFVSLLSDQGVPIEDIARLVGHRSTTTTEVVYRKQIRPVVDKGAVIMNDIFSSATEASPQTPPKEP